MSQQYLPGFDFESMGAESEDDIPKLNQEDIERSFLWGTDWTVGTLLSQIHKGIIKLDPIFQRRDAWSVERKSRFIESVILNLPIPQIVLAEDSDKSLVVVDGKQRLLSLVQFQGLGEWTSFTLKDTQILSLTGAKFEDIEKTKYGISFENNTIRTVILKNKPSQELINLVFNRLNTNSVALSPQELRQSLVPGEFTKFADTFTQNEPFLSTLFGGSGPDFRMRDVEIFIRYISFKTRFQEYTGNLKNFLDDTCKMLNKHWKHKQDEIEKHASNLKDAFLFTEDLMGEFAYRKYSVEKQSYEYRFNRAIFDLFAHYLTENEVREKIDKDRTRFVNAYKDLYRNQEFVKSIETTTKSKNSVDTRFGLFRAMLRDNGFI